MKETTKKKIDFLTKDSRKLKTRLLIALAVHGFAIFTAFFYPSLEVYLKSVSDFDFTFASLALVMGVAALLLLALGVGLSLLLKGRIFNYYVTTVFAVSLCSYLQGTFMNGSLPALNGDAVPWQDLTKLSLLNLAIWAVFFMAPFVLHFFSRDFWQKAVVYISCLCIIMNVVSLVSVYFSANLSENENKGFFSREGLYDTSDKGDVVVFILDFYDNEYMDGDLAAYPDLLSEWTGFTRFENCTGMYKQTMPSIPYILTGSKWYCETPAWSSAPQMFKESDFLERVSDTGADIGLYVSGNANAKEAYAAADNYNNMGTGIKPFGMFKSMTNYLLYRNMPIISKSVFWHYTDDISNASVKTDNPTPKDTTYTIDDALFLDEFQANNGLTVTNDKSFRFIHMRGAHFPYVINEFGEPASEIASQRQRRGIVYIVSEYLKAMKENGTYDNSTIIIMADHGWTEVAEQMSEESHPILFVKPAGADSSAPVKSSSAPVSQEDFHATVLWALRDENYSDYGRTFFEIGETEDRVRNFYFTVAFNGSDELSLLEYEIRGDARDFSNWKLTGKVWGDKATE